VRHRFAYLYGLVETFNLPGLLHDLSLGGITLSNPANGRVTALTPDGDQVDVTLDLLTVSVSSGDSITFQVWMPNHADVCCRFRHLAGNRIVEEYGLVGLNQDERSQVLHALVERFSTKAAQEQHLFFVGDPEGYSIDVDWDELAVTGKYEPKVCPDFLGIPLQRLMDFERCRASSYRSTRIGEYLILRNSLR